MIIADYLALQNYTVYSWGEGDNTTELISVLTNPTNNVFVWTIS